MHSQHHRSSKLVVRVRFPSPDPTEYSQLSGPIPGQIVIIFGRRFSPAGHKRLISISRLSLVIQDGPERNWTWTTVCAISLDAPALDHAQTWTRPGTPSRDARISVDLR